MKKYFLFLFFLSFMTLSAFAQPRSKKNYYTMGWNVSLPISSLSEYISMVSLNGGSVRSQCFVSDNFALGASFGWNTYYQETDHILFEPAPGVALTTKTNNYLSAIPIKATVHYFFYRKPAFELYCGIGLGGVYMTQHATVQENHYWNAQWGFLFSPETGLVYRFSRHWGVSLWAGYDVSSNVFDFGQLKVENPQNVHAGLGLTYLL